MTGTEINRHRLPEQDNEHWIKLGVSIACWFNGALLMGRRREGTYAGQWALPGGGVLFGETSRMAAVRELREETGVQLGDFFDTMPRVLELPDLPRPKVLLAYEGLSFTREHLAECDEFSEIAWLEQSEIRAKRAAGQLSEPTVRILQLLNR